MRDDIGPFDYPPDRGSRFPIGAGQPEGLLRILPDLRPCYVGLHLRAEEHGMARIKTIRGPGLAPVKTMNNVEWRIVHRKSVS